MVQQASERGDRERIRERAGHGQQRAAAAGGVEAEEGTEGINGDGKKNKKNQLLLYFAKY